MNDEQPARILFIDQEAMSMVIDWGVETLNHGIPLEILENPNMSPAEMRESIESMRPPKPPVFTIPETLLNMIEPVEEDDDSRLVLENEVLL